MDYSLIALSTSIYINKVRSNALISKILPSNDLTALSLSINENREFKDIIETLSEYNKSKTQGLSMAESGDYTRWFTSNVVKEQFRRIKQGKPRYEDNFLLMVAYNIFSSGADLSASVEMKRFDKETKERILKLIWGGSSE